MSTEGRIDITGLDRADVLRALYDGARPRGLGFLHYTPQPMTRQEADDLLQDQDYFDYIQGRVMKIRLEAGATSLDPWLYDRDNGPGAAQAAIDGLRAALNKPTDGGGVE